jgi:hypothetical protein
MEDYFLTENIVQKNAITRNPYVLVGYWPQELEDLKISSITFIGL